jgi:hypothetical protein
MRTVITREEAMDMEDAHGEGLHGETPRDGCPTCQNRDIKSYPTHAEVRARELEVAGLSTLMAHNDHLASLKKAAPAALSDFESACNTIALVFPNDSPQRRIALQARGDMREANGEART